MFSRFLNWLKGFSSEARKSAREQKYIEQRLKYLNNKLNSESSMLRYLDTGRRTNLEKARAHDKELESCKKDSIFYDFHKEQGVQALKSYQRFDEDYVKCEHLIENLKGEIAAFESRRGRKD